MANAGPYLKNRKEHYQTIYFSRCIIALRKTPPRSHVLYVLDVVGPCSLVFGVRVGALRRPRWLHDVDLIRELTVVNDPNV